MPSRVSDMIREHCLTAIGVVDAVRKPSLEQLKETEWFPEFERMMRNRLIMGALRYDTFEEKARGHNWDLLAAMRAKLDLYEKTGNSECLVDLANYAGLEFTFGNGLMKPTDDCDHCPTR